MNIYEYQAKEILTQYGVLILPGRYVTSMEEVVKASNGMKKPVLVKAQVCSGGRAKAGGVVRADDPAQLVSIASNLLGKEITTIQSGTIKIRGIYIEDALDEIEESLYISLLLNRNNASILLLASKSGGIDIEDVAKLNPSQIVKINIDLLTGIMPFHIRKLHHSLGLQERDHDAFSNIVKTLYTILLEKDALQIEINPLAIKRGADKAESANFIPLDAKFTFDDFAIFRHPDLAKIRDISSDNPIELIAAQKGLNYVDLETQGLGCVANGSGLIMSLIDIVQSHGVSVAGFVDIGGTASDDKIREAIRLLLMDPKVSCLLINILGYVIPCDIIAEDVISALRDVNSKIPLIIRLYGPKVDDGIAIIQKADLDILVEPTIDGAIKKTLQKMAELSLDSSR